MPRVHHVKKARKKNPAVKKGEPYYYWTTRSTVGKSWVSHKHYSATPPRPSQLTNSPFLSSVYALQEDIADAKPESLDDLTTMRDDWISQAEELRDECQEKLDNMPDGLREGDTGQLLQERYDTLDNWINEMGDVYCELDDEKDDEEEAVATKLEEMQSFDMGV